MAQATSSFAGGESSSGGRSGRSWPAIVIAMSLIPLVFGAGYLAGTAFRGGDDPEAAKLVVTGLAPSSVTSKPVAEAVKPKRVVQMPAEFEHQEAMLIACGDLLGEHSEMLSKVLAAIHDKTRVVALVHNATQEEQLKSLLRAASLPESAAEIVALEMPRGTSREFSPFFVTTPSGNSTILNCAYAGVFEAAEKQLSQKLQQRFGLEFLDVPLSLGGRSMESNGFRTCVSTFRLVEQNIERGYDISETGNVLSEFFGFDNWSCLTSLQNEPSGDIDLFVAIVDRDLSVVGRLDPLQDGINAQILDANSKILSELVTTRGPMRVERVDMPSNLDGIWRSYTSVIFANGVVLVPQYPSVAGDLDARALALYQRLLPSWKVVGINVDKFAQRGGGLRTIAMNIPSLRESADKPQ